MIIIWCDTVLLGREVCGILTSHGYMEAEEVRRHGRTGKPFGSENVLTELEKKMGCILRRQNQDPSVKLVKIKYGVPRTLGKKGPEVMSKTDSLMRTPPLWEGTVSAGSLPVVAGEDPQRDGTSCDVRIHTHVRREPLSLEVTLGIQPRGTRRK